MNIYALRFENSGYGSAFAIVAAKDLEAAIRHVVINHNKVCSYALYFGKWVLVNELENISYSGNRAKILTSFQYWE